MPNNYTREEKDQALDEAWEIMNPKTETDAERLARVMDKSKGLKDDNGHFADVVQLDVDDYVYLIEQVKHKNNMLPTYVRMLKIIEDVHDVAEDADYEVNMKQIEDVTADFLYGGDAE